MARNAEALGRGIEERPSRFGRALDFMRVLWALEQGLQAVSQQMSSTLGVTWPQRLVIRVVGLLPGITPGELAEILHVSPSSLSSVLMRLARPGALERRADPADRRKVRLYLTREGKRLDGLQRGTVEATIHRALGELSPEQVRSAQQVLATLARQLEIEGNAPPRRKKAGRAVVRGRPPPAGAGGAL